jgi:hypothetical protein
MSGDDHRAARKTRRFDSAKLAELARGTGEIQPVGVAKPVIPVVTASDERPPARPRTETIEDPMTTAMLAEVARRAQTVDFDEKLIEDVVNNLGTGENTSHPHTRRRQR